jgi:hypothetical protein
VPLTHMFAKQSCVGIFRNERTKSTLLEPKLTFRSFRTVSLLHERRCKAGWTGRNKRTRSTPLDTQLMFWGVSNVSLLHESRCKTGRIGAINAQVRQTKLRWKISQGTHVIHSVGTKTHVLGRSGPFRYSTNVDAKLAELVPLSHKFAKRSYVRKFRNERTWSTPLDPKLMFWGVPDCFVTARMWMQNWPNLCH